MTDADRVGERARAAVRTAVDANLFVEAGAGTGKTAALVDRVVALVLAGRPIERIAAITFTERAAAELKDRIRAALEQEPPLVLSSPALVERALAGLDQAQISTIHAFGLACLRAFAAQAGIDPDFTVLDEVMGERRFQQCWREYVESLAAEPAAAAAVDRALGLGLTARDLQTLARDLYQRPDLAPRLAGKPLTAPQAVWPDLAQMQQQLLGLPLATAPSDDRLRRRVEALGSLVDLLVQTLAADREAVLASGAGVLAASFNVSSARVWGHVLPIVRETASVSRDDLRNALDALRQEALAGLLPFAVRFVLDDATKRGREGTLLFDDLILRVRDLLHGQLETTRALRRRYATLLIDEFQDTDPLQVEIARAFATDPAAERLEPGRLFLVGDPKQSIYRFRRADMAIYARTRSLMERDGATIASLSLNRRSRGAIIAWVNRVFAGLIGSGEDPGIQPPYHDIHSAREVALRGPGVAWLGGELDLSAREARRHEAEAIAAQCRAVLDEGWEVAGPDGAPRPATFRDIAILIPTRSLLSPLERALPGAGVPHRVEGGSLIYQTQEVRDLINCLTAIDDPTDEVAIVGALRSPAFACSDVEIARHRLGGGRFDHQGAERSGEGPVVEALRHLRELHDTRHQVPLAALVERFIAGRGLAEIGILDRGSRDGFRRLRFVVEQARRFEAGGPESLRAFVEWLETRAGEAVLDRASAGLDDDEDAVRVFTIHGAKGLEFPVVFVAGLASSPNQQTPSWLVDHARERVAVTVGAATRHARFSLGPVEELKEIEGRHQEAEANRLLYVAATRARDHLILFLYHTARADSCPARRLIQAGATSGAQVRLDPAPARRVVAAPFADLPVDLPEHATAEAFSAAREALVARATTQRYSSATSLRQPGAAGGAAGAPQLEAEQTDETEPWARGRGSTHLGRAVHAALQSLPWDAGEGAIAAFARAQAVAEAIPERSSDVARLVRRALASEAAGRARGARRALREVPFGVTLNDTVLEGFIDLVIETEEGLEIVDWKTDHISSSEVPARLKEYELQAGLYALGLEAATGRPVARVTYVFVSPGSEESPGDPAALAAGSRARLEAMWAAIDPS